ncbi:MAG: cytochrome c [Acidobacteriota bacterium]
MVSRTSRTSRSLGAAFLVAAMVASLLGTLQAQQTRSAAQGIYTDPQAVRGQAVYADKCASCHGPVLAGAQAPPLTGDDFIRIWSGPAAGLVDKIINTMPANDPGKLTRQQGADVVAYMLQAAKFPAGPAELATDDAALKSVAIPAPAGAAGAPASAASSAVSFPPVGNMAQLMRGMLFPTSNLIFNVQKQDPAAPRPAYQSNAVGFSWADWGAGIYPGWEMVDYAAVTIAESAPLMLTPGRRCENGRLVPVNDPDWIKFSLELAEAGKAALKAAQTRKQDVVSEATDVIATSCSHCHEAYRDKPVRGPRNPVDPSNKAARCVR